MFTTVKAQSCLRDLIGWKDHFDTNEIPGLSNNLKTSISGEFYQEKHAALKLDLIKSMLPENKDLEEYLQETEDAAIVQMLNDISTEKELSGTTKSLVQNDVIYNSVGWAKDTIVSQSRFVGIRFRLKHLIGLKVIINRFALQLDTTQGAPGLTVYLYHSSKNDYIGSYAMVGNVPNSFNWREIGAQLHADDIDLSGGYFYLGYYQDDLVGQAINYEKLDWDKGYCGPCDGGVSQKRYLGLTKFVGMESFYVPNADLLPSKEMFDPSSVIIAGKFNWGFNFNISVVCDLTNFWCDNKMTLRNLLGLKVTQLILNDMKFSMQINHIEEQLKMMIIRDLEGDKETNYINIPDKYERALKAVKMNHSQINNVCLPCSVSSGTSYGVM